MERQEPHLVCHSIPSVVLSKILLQGLSVWSLAPGPCAVGIPFSAACLGLMSWLCFPRPLCKPILTLMHSVQTPNSHSFSLPSQPSQGQDESSGQPPGPCWWLKAMMEKWHLAHIKCSVEGSYPSYSCCWDGCFWYGSTVWSNVKGLLI